MSGAVPPLLYKTLARAKEKLTLRFFFFVCFFFLLLLVVIMALVLVVGSVILEIVMWFYYVLLPNGKYFYRVRLIRMIK